MTDEPTAEDIGRQVALWIMTQLHVAIPETAWGDIGRAAILAMQATQPAPAMEGRREALSRMVALDEEMGALTIEAITKDAVLPPSRIIGSVSERFVEPLKFARYYIVEALEIQEQSDLRDALVTLDWLIDGDEA